MSEPIFADLPLETAQEILRGTLAAGREAELLPLAVAVLDARGVLKAFAAESGIALGRPDLAIGKANAALQFGLDTRELAERAKALPQFFTAAGQSLHGGFVPNPGGILIRREDGALLGAIGVSGDIGDRDEAAALAGLQQARLLRG